MGMRKRFDSNGNCIGSHNMLYDEIPDDYEIKRVILSDKVLDLSYLGVMKYLRSIKADKCLEDDVYYSSEVIGHMAIDYLESAMFLHKGVIADRGGEIVTYYFIPCAFLCKHAIELKLKECLLAEGKENLKGHSVLDLWRQIKNTDYPQYDILERFIEELEIIDKNGVALRYGINNKLEPLSEDFKFDIDNLISNTMYLFNVLDEYVIHKCRWDALVRDDYE